MGFRVLAVVIALLAGVPQISAAQGIEVTNTALVEVRTVGSDGKEKITYVDATKVTPGSAILYVIRYANKGQEPAQSIVVASQIPADLRFAEGSAEIEGAKVEFSIDGGKTFAARDALVVTGADGKKRPAVADDLTGLRWTILAPLAPGGEGTVSYRAMVK